MKNCIIFFLVLCAVYFNMQLKQCEVIFKNELKMFEEIQTRLIKLERINARY